jgi:Cu(I)/Ag(I) efflux system membrane fusion protein
MDLIPVTEESGEDLGPREIKLSERGESLAEVEVTPVERRYVTRNMRMVGKVAYDETRIAKITSRVAGRLDRLYVDYQGIEVREGDHLVYLYSPELLGAQQELIQAVEAVSTASSSQNPRNQERARRTAETSREKLDLLGFTAEQIQLVEKSGQAEDHITIFSPLSGVVIHKEAMEGQYVKTGSPIYTVADLSRVWVVLDAYESDLAWLHYGQKVTFGVEAYPGDLFEGTIAFIDPVLNPSTRTVKVRVNADNADGRLKPGMFIRATVDAQLDERGLVFSSDLAGKWISPMHPEIVKDAPGACDMCGMDLVSAESLGYAAASDRRPPLVIPASAPLLTGKRAVVYVRDRNRKGVYEGREIVLGSRAGKDYIVKKGLREGELVVSRGSFKIDSAMQIQAKPSMMNPAGRASLPGHPHGDPSGASENLSSGANIPAAFQEQLFQVFREYKVLSEAMSADDQSQVQQGASTLADALAGVDMSLLEGDAHRTWMKDRESLNAAAAGLATEELETLRVNYSKFSKRLIAAAKTYQLSDVKGLYVHGCPMALGGKGANWLQDHDETHNPYFSGGMLRCGAVLETLSGTGEGE